MDILKVFSSNLKKYRMNLGISPEAFAEKAVLHRTYISAIECGKRSIALEIETYLLFIDCSAAKEKD